MNDDIEHVTLRNKTNTQDFTYDKHRCHRIMCTSEGINQVQYNDEILWFCTRCYRDCEFNGVVKNGVALFG